MTQREIRTAEDMETAAKFPRGGGAKAALIKGGHMEGDAMDLLLADGKFYWLKEEEFRRKTPQDGLYSVLRHREQARPRHDGAGEAVRSERLRDKGLRLSIHRQGVRSPRSSGRAVPKSGYALERRRRECDIFRNNPT